MDWLFDRMQLLAGLIISGGVILACRKKVVAFFVCIHRFFTGPSRVEGMLQVMMKESGKRDEKLDRLCKAMFNGGKGGVEIQVAMLDACHKVAFEAAPYPSFQCDGRGYNRAINEAYRLLVGANHGEALAGTRWVHFLHGEGAEEYREEFDRCRLAKEDFIGEVEIRNPITGEHRGKWRIHAPCSIVGDGCVFVGRYIAALDETARKLAVEHGWNVRLG